jgi:hypothetical protein
VAYGPLLEKWLQLLTSLVVIMRSPLGCEVAETLMFCNRSVRNVIKKDAAN